MKSRHCKNIPRGWNLASVRSNAEKRERKTGPWIAPSELGLNFGAAGCQQLLVKRDEVEIRGGRRVHVPPRLLLEGSG